MSRRPGNDRRDALKVGELSQLRDNAEPSPVRREGVETGRARPTCRRAYGQGTVRTTNAKAVVKTIVVRKSAARKGVRVRVSVIPNHASRR
jgi:hypothetical protein